MDALILAGGYGSRLKPVTDHVHKSMIPFWEKPFLEYLINNLADLPKIDKIYILTSFQEKQIKEYFGNSWRNTPIKYLHQTTANGGTGDAISYAKDRISKDFICILGDVYLSKSQIDLLLSSKGNCLAVTKIPDPENHKIVNFDQTSLVTGFSNDGSWADLGFWRFTPDIFDFIEQARLVLETEQELKTLKVINLYLDQLKPQIIKNYEPWIQYGDHDGIQGVLTTKDLLKPSAAAGSSIGCKTDNCFIYNSIVFGPGKLIKSKIKNSLVYVNTKAEYIDLNHAIEVV